MRHFLLCWWLIFLAYAAGGQNLPPAAPATKAPKRQLQAARLTQPIKLDGLLDEPQWQEAPVATDFIQNRPNPGPHEKHPTEVRVLYDDAALYIGAVMHEASADSIMRELTQRDDLGNTDFFAIFLDTYHDQLNGYSFFITPGGVQLDARYSPAGGEDFAWNAVWESRTAVRGTDWVAELRIPYSAIRFSKVPEQLWGLNFMRQRRRDNQGFFWSEVKPEVDGFVNQWGELRGVKDIEPPLRLSLTPYVSAYVNHYPYKEQGKQDMSTVFNGGADVKWGINESFTLDATLVPDFGQVQSDNQVLNLSPFEVQFNENRQFFTEGTELFNKGDLFYSRRVGATPIGFSKVEAGEGEEVVENPGVTRLLNATKVSGRTSKGLGVGIFNALSNTEHATLRDSLGEERKVLTQPTSNYNIIVLDQSLKNNSFVSLVNTNVTRRGQTYDANVTGGLFRFADKKNAYAVDGQVVYSRRRGQAFGSSDLINDQDGYKYQVGFGKISGNFTWKVNHGIESDKYNPNDLGLLFSNNSVEQSIDFNYNKFKPFWKVNNFYSFFGLSYNRLYKPSAFQEVSYYSGFNTTFTKSFLQVGMNFNGPLGGRRDYFEPRVGGNRFGRYYVRVPGSVGIGTFVSSDYRKKLALDTDVFVRAFAADGERTGRVIYSYNLGPRYRVSNQLTFRYNLEWELRRNAIGYAGDLKSDEPLDKEFIDRQDVILGRRRQVTVTNTVSGSYTFNNRMSLTVRTRHYTSNVHYHEYFRLLEAGKEESVDYPRNRDTSFNAFNVDAVYTWWFAPGSQISVVWKNAGSNFLEANQATPLYFDNLNNTINTPHNNSVSVKILYFLDYLTLKKRG